MRMWGLAGWMLGAALLLAAVAAGGGAASADTQGGDVEVRVAAQRLADGRVEFAVQQRIDGAWGERRQPRARYLPDAARAERWYDSSEVDLAGGAQLRVAARRLNDGRIEFAVQQRVDGAWGERLLPTSRYMPANAPLARWLHSSAVALAALTADPSAMLTYQAAKAAGLSSTAIAHIHGGAVVVRIAAKRLADGWVEFATETSYTTGGWSDLTYPREHQLPPTAAAGRWYASTSYSHYRHLRNSPDDIINLGVAARRLNDGRIEFAVRPMVRESVWDEGQRVSEAVWGERLRTRRRYLPADAPVGRWRYTSAFLLPSTTTEPSATTDQPLWSWQRTYAWETVVKNAQLSWRYRASSFTIDDARSIANAVYADYFGGDAYPPVVYSATAGGSSAGRGVTTGGHGEINLQYDRGLSLPTLLHELAHIMVSHGNLGHRWGFRYAPHGPEFAAQWLALWDRYAVEFDIDAARRSAVAAGISVSDRPVFEPIGDAASLSAVRRAIDAALDRDPQLTHRFIRGRLVDSDGDGVVHRRVIATYADGSGGGYKSASEAWDSSFYIAVPAQRDYRLSVYVSEVSRRFEVDGELELELVECRTHFRRGASSVADEQGASVVRVDDADVSGIIFQIADDPCG